MPHLPHLLREMGIFVAGAEWDSGLLELLAPRWLHSRIVPALGPHRHLAMPLGFGIHVYCAEATLTARLSRLIANRILVPNVARNGLADLVHFVQRLRKKRDAARPLRHHLQRTPRPLRVLFIPQDSNGVHRRTILFLQMFHRLLE